MKKLTDEFRKNLEIFIERVQEKTDNTVIEYRVGKRWVKIISRYRNQKYGSVWAFVDPENGDVYKPASWNKPGKNVKRNIKDNPFSFCTKYGPN